MVKPAWHMAVPSFILAVVACSEASATYVGDRFFVSTLVTVVPTPADFLNFPHFVMLPEVDDTRETDFLLTYSKLITKEWSVFFTETYRVIDEAGMDTVTGFENLVIGTHQLGHHPGQRGFPVRAGAIIPINKRSGEGLGVRAQIHFLGNIFPDTFGPIFDN